MFAKFLENLIIGYGDTTIIYIELTPCFFFWIPPNPVSIFLNCTLTLNCTRSAVPECNSWLCIQWLLHLELQTAHCKLHSNFTHMVAQHLSTVSKLFLTHANLTWQQKMCLVTKSYPFFNLQFGCRNRLKPKTCSKYKYIFLRCSWQLDAPIW